jgi:hypothetical protein
MLTNFDKFVFASEIFTIIPVALPINKVNFLYQKLVNLVNIVGYQLKVGHLPISADSVSLSGIVEIPRSQAKQVLRYRQAICHSGHRAGIQGIRLVSDIIIFKI